MSQLRQLLLSDREYDLLLATIKDSINDDPRFPQSPVRSRRQPAAKHNANIAAIRAACRVYLGVSGSLKLIDLLAASIRARRSPRTEIPRRPLVASRQRLGLSIAALLFFHRTLYRLLTRLRFELLHEKVQGIRKQWPGIYRLLTWRFIPALGASLSGLALGICGKDQLRVTIAIYVFVRACELLFKGAEVAGYIRNRPRWFGSWILFALAQGQLLHTFVFDPECFPQAYGDTILRNTPEYLQKPPPNLSAKVTWPTDRQVVDSLAGMAQLRWPAFTSPILTPKLSTTVPSGISSVISPIVSRAHPALHHLSCALLHPSETSCFTPFLRQFLLSFVSIGRFFTLYYGAFSLIRIRSTMKAPLESLARLVGQILKVTLVVTGAIAGSWGSICLFNNFLPKSFLPKSRFFLGGLLAGSIAIIDKSATAHENAMYVTRTSIDSLWKVGVKRRWWKGVNGGDVLLFTAALAVLNVLYDAQKHTSMRTERTMSVIRVLRGDIEVGLSDNKPKAE